MKKNIIKLLAGLILFAGVGLEVQAKDIKFVQVTDVHYTKGNQYSLDALEGAVKEINKLDDVNVIF